VVCAVVSTWGASNVAAMRFATSFWWFCCMLIFRRFGAFTSTSTS
jgi:hypothetical protein